MSELEKFEECSAEFRVIFKSFGQSTQNFEEWYKISRQKIVNGASFIDVFGEVTDRIKGRMQRSERNQRRNELN